MSGGGGRIWEPGVIGVGERGVVCLSLKGWTWEKRANLTKMLSPKGLAQRAKWRKPTEKGWEPRMQDIGGISLDHFLCNFEVSFFWTISLLMGNLNISCEKALRLGDCKMTYYVSGTWKEPWINGILFPLALFVFYNKELPKQTQISHLVQYLEL